MADLSPQAQAVLDAANGAGCHGPDDVLNDSRWIAAAALHAAAKELGPKRTLPLGYIFSAPAEQMYYEFRLRVQRDLHAIAAELDGTQPLSENV